MSQSSRRLDYALSLEDVSSVIFALTLIGIGLTGLIGGTYGPIWLPVPAKLSGHNVLAYPCAVVALLAGAGLLSKRTAAPAALALFAYLSIWTAAFKVPFILRDPLTEVNYQSCGENLVLVAAAWTLYARAAGRSSGLRAAHMLYGLALVAFGLSHFFYMQFTAPLVPKWLPAPAFWAYLTGFIYLTTGVLIATGFRGRLAAYVAAMQITVITFLVWGPPAIQGKLGGPLLEEAIISWALSAGAWVIAALFDPCATPNLATAGDRAPDPIPAA